MQNSKAFDKEITKFIKKMTGLIKEQIKEDLAQRMLTEGKNASSKGKPTVRKKSRGVSTKP